MSFTDVAEKLKAPTVQNGQRSGSDHGPSPASAFAGFDDWMETKEPGWKAKQAAERADRSRHQAEERAAVIAQYGSEEAAIAPCQRERALNVATVHLARRVEKASAGGAFFVGTLDGWSGGIGEPPASVIEAVSAALPMPATIREAKEEHEYWESRNREVDAIHGFTGDVQLGLAAEARWGLVRNLYERGMPIRTVDDMHVRMQLVATSEFNDTAADAAPVLLEAFERLVIDAKPAGGCSATDQAGQQARASDRRARIIAMLSNSDTANLSDREIARRVGVSPSTVGALRRRMAAPSSP